MYLNVNLATNASGVSAEGSCTTPRTPEILNLLAGAPFDNIASLDLPTVNSSSSHGRTSIGASGANFGFTTSATAAAASTPGEGPSSPREHASFSSFSSLSSPGTPSTPSSLTGPPSIQNTRTYLIKEGLKLTIQSKRLASGRVSLENEQPQASPKYEDMANLTVEDEERRRRRRERNKVAATKCRHRKKERTVVLMQESDSLEDHNVSLRSEIQRLETEKRRLMDVLAMHSPNCIKSGNRTPVNCGDYMNELNGQSSSTHYANMTATSSISVPYADCPATGAQATPSSHYGNTDCTLYDCNRRNQSSVSGVMVPPVSSAGSFDLSPCLNYTSSDSSCSPYHPSAYSGNSSGQAYR